MKKTHYLEPDLETIQCLKMAVCATSPTGGASVDDYEFEEFERV